MLIHWNFCHQELLLIVKPLWAYNHQIHYHIKEILRNLLNDKDQTFIPLPQNAVEEMEKERGAPYPLRKYQLKSGRPMK